VYDQHYTGASVDILSFRWSAEEGLLPLEPVLWLPEDQEPERFSETQLSIEQVASRGGALLGQRTLDEYETFSWFYWNRESGPHVLDFDAAQMSSDGRVVVGVRDGQAVRWTLATGTQALLPGASVASNVRAEGQAVVFTDGTRLLVQHETSGLSEVELTPTAALGTLVSVIALSEDGRSLVGGIGSSPGEVSQLFIWTRDGGVRWLDPTPSLPPNPTYYGVHLSADGRSIIGRATPGPDFQGPGSAFHWTEETGMQALGPDLGLIPTYLSPNGDVVVGYYLVDGRATGFRWTPQAGMRPLQTWEGVTLGGHVFLQTKDRGGLSVNKFDEALNVELPVDALAGRLVVPEGWSWPGLGATAENGRLIAGFAQNPQGESQAWLVHLHEVCPPSGGSDE
jgi:hypothetical protein